MNHPPTDFTAARDTMVDGQIRPNRVNDPRVLDAMRSLPREQFVPPHLAATAYIDEDLPLGGGRVLVEPLVTARLVQSARLRPGERALVVGAGTGYGAVLAAACGAKVTALEEDEALVAIALKTVPRHAADVRIVSGRLAAGLPGDGPWDAIIIEGAVPAIPESFAGQLAPGGRITAVLRPAGSPVGRIVLAEPTAGAGSKLRARDLFDSATPLIPSLVPAPAFVF